MALERDPNGPGRLEDRAEASQDPLIGTVVAGRFHVRELVARGGMGRIYRATQQPLGREIALKVLAPAGLDVDDAGNFQLRFEREASHCARLAHANTVRVFDFGAASGVYFIAMEFIHGTTLHRTLKREAPLEPLRVLHIARQICGSLREAHAMGVVHRDLKPGNILLTTQNDDADFVKVVDFGLVKQMGDDAEVTQAGLIVGSPLYMSPEQIRGKDVDLRADIYSLGVLLNHMLTGKNPFERETSVAVLVAHMQEPVPSFAVQRPDLAVSASFEWVVRTCLEKDRSKRFRDMGEVLRALKAVEAELQNELSVVRLGLDSDGRTVLPPEVTDATISRMRMSDHDLDREEPSAVRSAVRQGLPAVGLVALLVGVGALLLAFTIAFGTGLGWFRPSEPPRGELVQDVAGTAATPTEASVPSLEVKQDEKARPASLTAEGAADVPAEEVAAPEVVVEPEPPAPVVKPAPAKVAPKAAPKVAPKAAPKAAPTTAPTTAAPKPVAAAPAPAPVPAAAGTTAEPESPADPGWKVRSDTKNPFDKSGTP